MQGLKAAKWETLVSAAGLDPLNTRVHSIKFDNTELELIGNRGRCKEKLVSSFPTPSGYCKCSPKEAVDTVTALWAHEYCASAGIWTHPLANFFRLSPQQPPGVHFASALPGFLAGPPCSLPTPLLTSWSGSSVAVLVLPTPGCSFLLCQTSLGHPLKAIPLQQKFAIFWAPSLLCFLALWFVSPGSSLQGLSRLTSLRRKKLSGYHAPF